MERMFASVIAGVLGVAGVACSAQGQGVIEQCNGCAGRQYEQFAISLGLGDHLVGDFSNNFFSGYHVLREPTGKGGYIYEADSFAVTSVQQAAFNDYRKLIVDYHSSAIIVSVPNPRPAGYPTALDGISAVSWAGIPNYTNAMAVWISSLQQAPGPIGWMSTPADVALLAMQSGVDVSGYTSSITFEVHTTAHAVVTFKWSDGKLALVSVVDQYGNNIPLRNFSGSTAFGGSYFFSDANPGYSQSLLDYLNGLGAKISVNPSQFPLWEICVGVRCDPQPN
jgi:hypothetical protein